MVHGLHVLTLSHSREGAQGRDADPWDLVRDQVAAPVGSRSHPQRHTLAHISRTRYAGSLSPPTTSAPTVSSQT